MPWPHPVSMGRGGRCERQPSGRLTLPSRWLTALSAGLAPLPCDCSPKGTDGGKLTLRPNWAGSVELLPGVGSSGGRGDPPGLALGSFKNFRKQRPPAQPEIRALSTKRSV